MHYIALLLLLRKKEMKRFNNWRYHEVATTKSPSKLDGLFVVATLWYLQESNQGHTDFQSVALPTELRYHAVKRVQI